MRTLSISGSCCTSATKTSDTRHQGVRYLVKKSRKHPGEVFSHCCKFTSNSLSVKFNFKLNFTSLYPWSWKNLESGLYPIAMMIKHNHHCFLRGCSSDAVYPQSWSGCREEFHRNISHALLDLGHWSAGSQSRNTRCHEGAVRGGGLVATTTPFSA